MRKVLVPRTAVISIAFVLAAAPAVARPLISIGGGLAADNAGTPSLDPAPLVVVGVQGTINQRWSAFARAGYTGQSRTASGVTCLGLDCPGVEFTDRQRYVPVTVGLRVSSPGIASPRPFFEIASSLSAAWFDAETRLSYVDRVERITKSEWHALPGFEIGGGMRHPLGGRTGLEWGIRYSYADGPRKSTRSEGIGPTEVSRLSFVLSLTL